MIRQKRQITQPRPARQSLLRSRYHATTILAALACACLLLSGCIGKSGPQIRYLRLEYPKQNDCPRELQQQNTTTIALKSVRSLPGLDNSAVMFADNGVLAPSPAWRFEGSPQEMIAQALVLGLPCQGDFSVRDHYLPSAAQELVLTCKVLAFEVDRNEPNSFRIRLYAEAADRNNQTDTTTFEVREPVPALAAEEIAQAAEKSVAALVKQVAVWLGTL